MTTVAHTILEFGPRAVNLPVQPERRFVVVITASYIVVSDDQLAEVEGAIGTALRALDSDDLNKDGEEPSARVEIHNIPEESGT